MSAVNEIPMKDNCATAVGTGGAHQHRIVALRAVDRHAALNDAEREGEHQRIVADFGDHWTIPFPAVPVFLPVVVLPVSLLLETVGDLARHVILVVLGEHAVGLEGAGLIERAFGHHALPFAEQIGQQALIRDRDGVAAVGHGKADLQVLAAGDAAFLHQPAETNARAGRDLLLDHVGRRIEEDDRILQRGQHQPDREHQHGE